jgi:calcineurin-like phosphoesterase family protein
MTRKIWVISDTHFGHENMYRFTTFDGTHRVRERFMHAAEADIYMCDQWAQRVRPWDHVYHLGDVGFTRDAVGLVKKLPGKKRLVLGNHDQLDMSVYRECGFQKIMLCRFYEGLLLTHMPVHPSCLWGERIRANIHGHTHERQVVSAPGEKPYMNVCVEHTDYCPVDLEDLRARIA